MLTKIMLSLALVASIIACVSCASPKPTLLQQKVAEARAERTNKVSTFSFGGSTFVTILITGLASLGDADSSATPTPKILYLIDATSPGGSLMAHAPIVMTDAVYNPVATGRTLETEGAAARFLRLTNGEKLSFKEANPTLSPLTYSKKAPLATCPEDTDLGSLFFLPHLSQVGMSASGGTLSSADYDSTFLNPQAGGPVAAFFPIDYGELLSWFQTPLVWDFKDSAGKKKTVSQVLADAVIWKFAIPGNTLTLQSNGGELLRMTAVQNEIMLTIANAPDPDGIELLAGTATNLHPKKHPVDEHFDLYYRFLTDKSVTPFRPVVQGVCQKGVVVKDECTLANFVEISKTDICPPPLPGEIAPPLVGGLNCGPDGMP